MRPEMADTNLELIPVTNEEEMRRKRRKKRKRVGAVLVVAMMTMISDCLKHKEASTYRHKVVKFWDSISIVYCKDHATGEASRTASECSKEMTKEDSTTKEDGSTSSASLKRQRSDDSFTSMISKKMDVVVEALKDDGPKGPTADEIRVALDDIPELDEDTYLDLYDILTSNARKFESMMALPMERRRRWLLKQLKK
ncbi:hypothetical protein ACP70R_015591 [Stipagrostis hirtigluma subsp. patula]